MVDVFIKALQLIGSLMAVGLTAVALMSYLAIWLMDHFGRQPMTLDTAVPLQ